MLLEYQREDDTQFRTSRMPTMFQVVVELGCGSNRARIAVLSTDQRCVGKELNIGSRLDLRRVAICIIPEFALHPTTIHAINSHAWDL